MANFTIRELLTAKMRDLDYRNGTFLFQHFYDRPIEDDTEDLRPGWAKEYTDTVYPQYVGDSHPVDDYIATKYGEWVFTTSADSADSAYTKFYNYCTTFSLLHRSELDMVYKAFRTEYNPTENYDRYEITEDEGGVTIGATSKTSPDDSEMFYNVGGADSNTDTSNKRESHIHGNIGVTTTTAMIREAVSYFTDNAFMDWFIERIIKDSCILVD